jgi:membrane protein DedA with SNARE-associated domain
LLLHTEGVSDLLDLSTFYFYFGIFISLVAAGVGVPIPEEIPVVTGGALVGHADNNLRWWIMLPVCIAGVVLSDGLLYGIGRLWGPRLVEYRWLKERLLPPERRERIESNFREYGVKILLFARFLPAIRSPIFITAGIMRVPLSRFLLADGIYAIPGVSLLFFLGFWFTDQFKMAVEKAESYRPIVVVLILFTVGIYLLYHFFTRPMATGDPKELPVIGNTVAKLTHTDMPSPVAASPGDGRQGTASDHPSANDRAQPASGPTEHSNAPLANG